MAELNIKGKRTSKRNCCVVGCHNYECNTTRDVQFYAFPGKPWEKDYRRKWIQAVNRKNEDGSQWEPTKFSKICSVHFVGNKKSGHPLSPSYVPSIFPEVYKRKQFTNAEKERFKRNQKLKLATRLPPPTPFQENAEQDLPYKEPRPNTVEEPKSRDASTQSDVDIFPLRSTTSEPKFDTTNQKMPIMVDKTTSVGSSIEPKDKMVTDPPTSVVIKEERKEEEEEYGEAPPILEVNVKHEYLASEVDVAEASNELRGSISSNNPALAALYVKQENEGDARQSNPLFGFVDVDIGRLQLPAQSEVSDVDPLQLLNIPVAPSGALPEPRHPDNMEPVLPFSSAVNVAQGAFKANSANSSRKSSAYHVGMLRPASHPCDTCGKVLSSASSLKKHASLHMALKRYKCSDCNAAFARSDYLLKHALTHNGLKDFACDTCEKTFTRSSSLAKHMKSHSAARPFSCDECELSFTHRHQLVRHLRSLRVKPC